IPCKVQQVMSSEWMLILSGTIPAFRLFMMAWEQLAEKHPHLWENSACQPFRPVGLSVVNKHA
ncbi:hypothetical protein L208DRAFT_1274248, partial [Tricholoma matsutake]